MLEFPTYSQEEGLGRHVGKVRWKKEFYVGVSNIDLESMLVKCIGNARKLLCDYRKTMMDGLLVSILI